MAMTFTLVAMRITMRIMTLTTSFRTAAMLMVCVGLYSVRVDAANLDSAASTEAAAGSLFCNGIRLGDEIVVVDTRMVCGTCDPESLRSGVRVENYEVQNDAGRRRWRK